jgi:hypothetical protein
MGGFDKFRSLGLEDSTIATWLDDAGYDTMLIGKYFNGYDNTTHVPSGWDEWHGYLGDYVQSDTYRINENGQINTYARSQIHDTDLFAEKAATFLVNTAVRTGRYLFTRYATGEKELYDLSTDPYELKSVHNTASTELKRRLASRLDALESCAAQSCRGAEN